MENKRVFNQSELEGLLEKSESFDILASIAATTSPEDQDYIAQPISRLLSEPGGLKKIKARMREFMDPEKTLVEVTQHVLTNREQPLVKFEDTAPDFQDMVLKLKHLSETGNDGLAKAILLYAIGMAGYEWKDRQRPSIPYDPMQDPPITLAYRSPED